MPPTQPLRKKPSKSHLAPHQPAKDQQVHAVHVFQPDLYLQGLAGPGQQDMAFVESDNGVHAGVL